MQAFARTTPAAVCASFHLQTSFRQRFESLFFGLVHALETRRRQHEVAAAAETQQMTKHAAFGELVDRHRVGQFARLVARPLHRHDGIAIEAAHANTPGAALDIGARWQRHLDQSVSRWLAGSGAESDLFEVEVVGTEITIARGLRSEFNRCTRR